MCPLPRAPCCSLPLLATGIPPPALVLHHHTPRSSRQCGFTPETTAPAAAAVQMSNQMQGTTYATDLPRPPALGISDDLWAAWPDDMKARCYNDMVIYSFPVVISKTIQNTAPPTNQDIVNRLTHMSEHFEARVSALEAGRVTQASGEAEGVGPQRGNSGRGVRGKEDERGGCWPTCALGTCTQRGCQLRDLRTS